MKSCAQLILSWGGEGPGLEIRGHAVDRPAGEGLHERRLAGAVRADDAVAVPLHQLQGRVLCWL